MIGVGKRVTSEIVFDTFNVLFLGVLSIVFLYPMLYVIFASFSDPAQLISHTGVLLGPKGFPVTEWFYPAEVLLPAI